VLSPAEHSGAGGDRGRHVHDPSPAGGEHPREHAPGKGHRTDHVNRDRSGDGGGIDVLSRAERPHDRGVVDQQFDVTELVDEPLNRDARLLWLAHVRRERHRGAAGVVDLGAGVIDFMGGPGEQSDARSGLREAERDPAADPAARSCDQRRSAIEA
jgi:hypothetical protein